MNKVRVVSLFSGIGGFETGIFEALGKENVEVVFSSEIDKFANKSYELLYNHAPFGDITQIKSEEDFRIRKLTPLECFRLQGFPDDYYYILKENGISNSQLYKMAGNAVSVPVIKRLVENLFKGEL